MTINPVDLQVMLPQTGQVNRIQRGLQHQQQTEQQILGQMVQQEMKLKEQTIEKMKPTDKNKIHNEEQDRKKDKRHNNKRADDLQSFSSQDKEEQNETEDGEKIGCIFDVKV